MDYKVTPYTNKIFASDILSYLNVDSTGDVVSVEVWNTLWNSMFDFASNVNEHMQELLAEDTGLIPRLIAEHQVMLSEHAQILQEHEVLKKQFATITEAINRVDQQAAEINVKHKEVLDVAAALTEGFVHCGPDAPQNPNTVLWIHPTDNAQSVVGVGEPTPEGGEIFNDYNTNKALSAFATAKGSNNIAGGKCFKVIADPIDNGDGTGVYTLDSVEGLEIGMRYSTFLQTQSVDAGEITAIDTNTKTITVKGFVYYPLDKYADDPKNLNITNSLLITGRPDLGTTDIGFTAFIGGKGNFAQNTYTLAFGEGNYVLGKYGTAFGIRNVAAYNSFVAGQDNRNLGATSFIVGNNNIATANRAFVTGQSNKATAPNSFVGGQNTTIKGTNSLGYGSWNTVEEDASNSAVFGSSNQVKGKNSFAAGSSLVALQDNQCVIGVKNRYSGSSDALFIIGNGSNVKGHSNAFTVHKDGHAEVQSMGDKPNDNTVATKAYVDSTLLGVSPVTPADYVVDYGTFVSASQDDSMASTTWNWEIWNSGKAVCWSRCTLVATSDDTLTYHTLFPLKSNDSVFEFIEPPIVQATVSEYSDKTRYGHLQCPHSEGYVSVVLFTEETQFTAEDTVQVDVYVVGKWK